MKSQSVFRWLAVGSLPFLVTACGKPPEPATVTAPPAQASVPPPPDNAAASVVEHGKGSFYADSFDGRITASGAPMDQAAFTAASKDLPIGTKAQVTNLQNGKTVMVEVNDRGPFVPGRIIDLSKHAANQIGIDDQKGVAPVKVEALPEQQPTPELKDKVAKVAARKARAHHRKKQQLPATSPATPATPTVADR